MSARSILSKGVIVALALASIGGAASIAAAQDYTVYGQRPGTKLQLVPYRDLNLVYRDHQRVLNQRVGLAVRRVCNFDNGNIPILDNDYRVCRDDAWGSARPQISNAIMRAHHLASMGRTPRTNGYVLVDGR
jgi:UrcA family protein